MAKYIVDIHGEIEGDYEIIGSYEECKQGEWKSLKGEYGIDYVKCSCCNTNSIDQRAYAPMNYCPIYGAEIRG